MLRISMKFSCLLLLLQAAATAQPVIQQWGVVNAAGNVPGALPNSGIAQGSVFLVTGTGLGADNPAAMNLFLNTAFPLPTSQGLNGTTVQVRSGGSTIYAILLYESATQIAAILPSTTPIGSAQVTVTYNGQTSASAPIQVLQRGVGVFSQNGSGAGPGEIFNYNSSTDQVLNRVSRSAQPGQTAVLVATGLGAVRGDESQATFPGNMPIALEMQLYVGGKPAIIDPSADYIGRFGCCGGIDQIFFQVPQGVQGCYVPVVPIIDNVVGNTTTMSITPGGGPCSEPSVGLSSADLQTMISNNSARVGTITLTRAVANLAANGQTLQQETDSGTAGFVNMTPEQFVASPGGFPTPGGCIVQTFSGSAPPAPSVGVPLDAGPSLNLNGPAGNQLLAQGSGGYTAQLPGGYLGAGSYESDDGGGGGDVGPFQVTLNTPAPFNWTNPPRPGSSLTHGVPINVTWTGGDPNSLVVVLGFSGDGNNNVGADFVCAAQAGAGALSVPPYILAALPANQIPIGLLSVSDIVQTRFSASGLDVGYFTYAIGQAVNVQYAGSNAKF